MGHAARRGSATADSSKMLKDPKRDEGSGHLADEPRVNSHVYTSF